MKKVVAIMLCAVMVLSLAACSQSGNSSAAPAQSQGETDPGKDVKKTLDVAIVQDPQTIYPYNQLSGVGRALYTPLFEALFAYGGGEEGVTASPLLCESYDVDDDHLGFTLHLKKGVKFHNGQEMTAEDVLFSFQCLLDCNWFSNCGDIDIENTKVIDDYTLYLKYKDVPGPFEYMMCNLYVLCKDYMEQVGKDNWTYNCIGTGPYMLDSYSQGVEYRFKKFDGYREEKKLDSITVHIINDASVQQVELETGSIDLAMGISFGDIEKYKSNTSDGYSTTNGPSIGSLALQGCFTNEMADVRVRQAFAYACNREAVNQIAYQGLAVPATNVYAHGIPAWFEAENQYGYQPEKAKQLLKEAGYPDGITIDLYNRPEYNSPDGLPSCKS